MISELSIWFPQHAQTLDFPLAAHLLEMGFDPDVMEPEPAHAGGG